MKMVIMRLMRLTELFVSLAALVIWFVQHGQVNLHETCLEVAYVSVSSKDLARWS